MDASCNPILCANRIVAPRSIQALFVSRLFRKQWHTRAMAWIWFKSVLKKRLAVLRHWNAEQTGITFLLASRYGQGKGRLMLTKNLAPQIPLLRRILTKLGPTRQHTKQQGQPARIRIFLDPTHRRPSCHAIAIPHPPLGLLLLRSTHHWLPRQEGIDTRPELVGRHENRVKRIDIRLESLPVPNDVALTRQCPTNVA